MIKSKRHQASYDKGRLSRSKNPSALKSEYVAFRNFSFRDRHQFHKGIVIPTTRKIKAVFTYIINSTSRDKRYLK